MPNASASAQGMKVKCDIYSTIQFVVEIASIGVQLWIPVPDGGQEMLSIATV